MKIFRLLILITTRQFYLLLKNLYHLVTSPNLALKTLLVTRDKSQIALLSFTFLSPTIFYLITRIFWDFYRFGHPLFAIGRFFYLTLFLQLSLFLLFLFSLLKNHVSS